MKTRIWKKPETCGRKLLLEVLEERIVLDAAVDPIPADNASIESELASEPANHESHFFGVGNSLAFANSLIGSSDGPISGVHVVPKTTSAVDQVFENALDVALISDSLQDASSIAAAAAPNAKVIYYSEVKDNLDTINQKLEQLVESEGRKIDHLAVASQCGQGGLHFGSSAIDLHNAAVYKPAFETLGSALTPDAQIQFYSCSLAGGQEGEMLVNSIAAFTGADVYASASASDAQSNNWTLEYSSSQKIPMASFFSAQAPGNVKGELGEAPLAS